jgi:hypothetical protein
VAWTSAVPIVAEPALGRPAANSSTSVGVKVARCAACITGVASKLGENVIAVGPD